MLSDNHGQGTQTTKEQFEKLASAFWTERNNKAGKHASITRGIDFKRAVSEVGQRRPGQNNKTWTDEVLSAIKTVGQFCSSAYRKMNDNDKRRFVVAFDELTENLDKVATDPTCIPQYTTEVYAKDAPVGSDLLAHGQPVARKSLFWASEKSTGLGIADPGGT